MSMGFRYQDESRRVLLVSKKAGTRGLAKAAYKVRAEMRKSIRKSASYARPGNPPHTRKGQLRKSILYDVDRNDGTAVVGPASHLFSDVASYHEHGGVQVKKGKRRKYRPGMAGPIAIRNSGVAFARLATDSQAARAQRLDRQAFPDAAKARRRRYPKRPFALPALERTGPRLPGIWEDMFNR